MADVDAVFENGVFRPTTPVSLPEGAHVHLQTVTILPTTPTAGDACQQDELRRQIYAVLANVQPSGHSDTAARHDDHAG